MRIPSLALRSGNYQLRLLAAYGSTSASNICDVIESAIELNVQTLDLWEKGKLIRSGNGALMQGEYLS